MKNLLTKTSFISFLLSAAISSSVQKKPIKAVMAQEATASVEKQEKVSLLAKMEDAKTKLEKLIEDEVAAQKVAVEAEKKQMEAAKKQIKSAGLAEKKRRKSSLLVIARTKTELAKLREETQKKQREAVLLLLKKMAIIAGPVATSTLGY